MSSTLRGPPSLPAAHDAPIYTRAEWAVFLSGAEDGEFDLL